LLDALTGQLFNNWPSSACLAKPECHFEYCIRFVSSRGGLAPAAGDAPAGNPLPARRPPARTPGSPARELLGASASKGQPSPSAGRRKQANARESTAGTQEVFRRQKTGSRASRLQAPHVEPCNGVTDKRSSSRALQAGATELHPPAVPPASPGAAVASAVGAVGRCSA